MVRTLRAVVFAGNYRPEQFGIGRFVPHYVDALADAGWSVDVHAPFPYYPSWTIDRSLPSSGEEHGGRVRVHRYAPYVPRRPNALTRALHEASIGAHALRRALAATRSADLVVAASPPLLGAAAAAAIARRRHTPSIVLAYDLVTDLAGDAFGAAGRIPGRVLQSLEATLYANASGVIALSDDMATRIRHLAGRDSAVIRIWADDELFEQDHTAAARAFRARLGIRDGQRLVGFAGNFGKKQRLPELAQALRQLPGDITALLVGDGPGRSALDGLRVLPPLPARDLHAFLTACDLSIVMAWTGHAGSLFPSKVANILAAGCPLLAITHAETELGRLIAADDLGIVCSSLDPGDMLDALRRGAVAGREEGREARCRRVAREQFDRRRAMARFLEQVERVLTPEA